MRHLVLRPDKALRDLVYAGDDHPDGAHFGAFDDAGRLVGIATLFPEPPPRDLHGAIAEAAFAPGAGHRLRGMATLPEVRGAGHGRALLKACFDHVRARGGRYLWCNARIGAVDFYRRLGLEAFGDSFEMDLIGPHFVMGASVEPAPRGTPGGGAA